MGVSKWMDMIAGTHGKATNTKTNPDTTKYVENKSTASGDKGSTVGTLRDTNRKIKEAADKAGE